MRPLELVGAVLACLCAVGHDMARETLKIKETLSKGYILLDKTLVSPQTDD